jgi:hypothetical protein
MSAIARRVKSNRLSPRACIRRLFLATFLLTDVSGANHEPTHLAAATTLALLASPLASRADAVTQAMDACVQHSSPRICRKNSA